MPRNTLIFVGILAVIAALVVGVNIGKSMGQAQPPSTTVTPTGTPALPQQTPTPMVTVFTNPTCGIQFTYPPTYTKLESEDGSAVIQNPQNKSETIAVACQKDIPRPPLVASKIETIQIGTMSAKLYHDASPKDGTPLDAVIFTHPKTKLDVFVGGYGAAFDAAIHSLTILF
jgi:hypothetical protein